jgi:hypothetical protein
MTGKSNPLDYASASRANTNGWAVATFVIGLVGAPGCVGFTWIFHSVLPAANALIGTAITSGIVIAFVFTTQSRWQGNRLGKVGLVLTLIWAPLFLVWSCIFIVSPI